jgi:hypothetical protein
MYYCNARELAPGEWQDALLLDEAIECAADYARMPNRWMNRFGKGIRAGYEPKSMALRVTYRKYMEVRRQYERQIKFKN